MRRAVWMAVAGLAGAVSVVAAGAVPGSGAVRVRPAGAAAGWLGRAIGVREPGRAAGRFADVLSVSCGSAGSCAAGGSYADRSGNLQGFVASQNRGVWGREMGLPGLAALNAGGIAGVSSVSCGSAGNCAAGGVLAGRSASEVGFVAAEARGRWGRAIIMPGPGLRVPGGESEVLSVSCGSAGGCAAGGTYEDRRGNGQGFVVSEWNGHWGQAIEVPGPGALNQAGNGLVRSVSCGSPGNCAAGGTYVSGGRQEGFVVSERNGRWGQAIEVPGLGALNAGGFAVVESVSCGPAGGCAAGGDYAGRSGKPQGFVALARHGVWGKAVEVPGLAALNTASGDFIVTRSVSCWAAGGCAAAGAYARRSGDEQGFVALARHGVWGKAIKVPGPGALNLVAVSCGPGGGCAAGGDFTARSGDQLGFVAVEQHGAWGKATAITMPAGVTLAEVNSVSCGSGGYCAAGGLARIARTNARYGFVISERHGRWGKPVHLVAPAVKKR
jgi:hypothetical protein